jgi:hypothetical protein
LDAAEKEEGNWDFLLSVCDVALTDTDDCYRPGCTCEAVGDGISDLIDDTLSSLDEFFLDRGAWCGGFRGFGGF